MRISDCSSDVCSSDLAATALGAQTNFFCQIAPLFGIIGGDHRIIGGKIPFQTIIVRSHLIMCHQMPLKHLQLLSVFQADNVVWLDRSADGDGRLLLYFRRCWRTRKLRSEEHTSELQSL